MTVCRLSYYIIPIKHNILVVNTKFDNLLVLCSSPPSYKVTPIKCHPSYQARRQMHGDSKILVLVTLREAVTEYKFHHNVCSSEILLCRKSSIRYYPKIIFHPTP